MSGPLVVAGVSHRTAGVADRERAALDAAATWALLRELRAAGEVVALSTCNRTELYGAGTGAALLLDALAERAGAGIARAAYVHEGEDAVRHVFRVAAGLDSMVVGESEIQGQVRAAVRLAEEAGACGPELRRLFRQATVAGRRVRNRTAIGERPVSVATVAAALAERALGDLRPRRVLLIGAGRTARATGHALRSRGIGAVVVANRTPEAARALAARLGGRAAALADAAAEAARADVVVASTDAPGQLLARADLAAARAAAAAPEPPPARADLAGRPLLALDLAVPRDLDPAIGTLPGVTLLDLDAVEAVARVNRLGRDREAAHAEAIVAEEVRRFAPLAAAH